MNNNELYLYLPVGWTLKKKIIHYSFLFYFTGTEQGLSIIKISLFDSIIFKWKFLIGGSCLFNYYEIFIRYLLPMNFMWY